MACEIYQTDSGHAVMVCSHGRAEKLKRCKFCGNQYHEGKLCDFPLSNGHTCDAEMCNTCARTLGRQCTILGHGVSRMGDSVDVCPIHRERAVLKDGTLQPEQPSLFEGGR